MKLIIFVFGLLQSSSALEPECDGCRDWYGSCRRNGDTWTDDDTWTYACAAGRLQFVGCQASARGQGKLIKSGSTQSIDDFEYKCEQLEDRLRYEQEPQCDIDGKLYHVEDTFRRDGVEIFEWICLRSGVWVSGCYVPKVDGSNDEELIPVNSQLDVGLIRHNCRRISDYPGRVQYWTSLVPESGAVAFGGRGDANLDAPVPGLRDQANLESSTVAQPWLHEFVADYVRMDDTYDVKIRYVD